ncbi:MAG: hypothetical protein IKH97_09160, partial [Bacteroidales bacterium]|nr:hypothetical protein [Bacteroidales bacterium]
MVGKLDLRGPHLPPFYHTTQHSVPYLSMTLFWLVLNGINLTLFCAKKQKRNGNYNKENDAEDVHPGVQVRSSELLLHAW